MFICITVPIKLDHSNKHNNSTVLHYLKTNYVDLTSPHSSYFEKLKRTICVYLKKHIYIYIQNFINTRMHVNSIWMHIYTWVVHTQKYTQICIIVIDINVLYQNHTSSSYQHHTSSIFKCGWMSKMLSVTECTFINDFSSDICISDNNPNVYQYHHINQYSLHTRIFFFNMKKT